MYVCPDLLNLVVRRDDGPLHCCPAQSIALDFRGMNYELYTAGIGGSGVSTSRGGSGCSDVSNSSGSSVCSDRSSDGSVSSGDIGGSGGSISSGGSNGGSEVK